MSTALLSVRNMATGYSDIRVVWDVSFDVWPGQVTALLGRNGAGKTTSLRAIAGLNPINAGQVTYQGTPLGRDIPAHVRVRNGISYVQEGKRIFPRQSVADNLAIGGYVLRSGRVPLAREIDRVYELFPVLHEKRHLPAGALSGGQQQMIAIGQALMARPKLLMLDEPSGGLAPVVVAEVMNRVAQLKDTGLAILLVEQAVDAAVNIADSVTVIDVGRVVMSSPIADIDDVEGLKDICMGR